MMPVLRPLRHGLSAAGGSLTRTVLAAGFIALFSLASIPAAMAVESVGTITYTRGEAWVWHGKRKVAAKLGLKVSPGDVVVTSNRARVKLRMSDNSNVYIASKSRIVIREYKVRKGRTEKGAFDLLWGKSRFLVNKLYKRGRLDVRTKTAVLGVRGTEFNVLYQPPPTIPKGPAVAFEQVPVRPTRGIITSGVVVGITVTGQVLSLTAGTTNDFHPDGTVTSAPTKREDVDHFPEAKKEKAKEEKKKEESKAEKKGKAKKEAKKEKAKEKGSTEKKEKGKGEKKKEESKAEKKGKAKKEAKKEKAKEKRPAEKKKGGTKEKASPKEKAGTEEKGTPKEKSDGSVAGAPGQGEKPEGSETGSGPSTGSGQAADDAGTGGGGPSADTGVPDTGQAPDTPPAAGNTEPPVAGNAGPPVGGSAEPPVAGNAGPPVGGSVEPPVAGNAGPPVGGSAEPPVAGNMSPVPDTALFPPPTDTVAPAVPVTPPTTTPGTGGSGNYGRDVTNQVITNVIQNTTTPVTIQPRFVVP